MEKEESNDVHILPKWKVLGEEITSSPGTITPNCHPRTATLLTEDGPLEVCIVRSKAVPESNGKFRCPVPKCDFGHHSRVRITRHFRNDHKNYRSWRDVFLKKDAPHFILKTDSQKAQEDSRSLSKTAPILKISEGSPLESLEKLVSSSSPSLSSEFYANSPESLSESTVSSSINPGPTVESSIEPESTTGVTNYIQGTELTPSSSSQEPVPSQSSLNNNAPPNNVAVPMDSPQLITLCPPVYQPLFPQPEPYKIIQVFAPGHTLPSGLLSGATPHSEVPSFPCLPLQNPNLSLIPQQLPIFMTMPPQAVTLVSPQGLVPLPQQSPIFPIQTLPSNSPSDIAQATNYIQLYPHLHPPSSNPQ